MAGNHKKKRDGEKRSLWHPFCNKQGEIDVLLLTEIICGDVKDTRESLRTPDSGLTRAILRYQLSEATGCPLKVRWSY